MLRIYIVQYAIYHTVLMLYCVLMAVYVNAFEISNPVQVTVMVFQSISWRRSEVCSFNKKTGEPSRWAGFSRSVFSPHNLAVSLSVCLSGCIFLNIAECAVRCRCTGTLQQAPAMANVNRRGSFDPAPCRGKVR